MGHKWIALLFFALSNNRTKIPHFKRLLSGGMSHRIFLFILDFILSMTLNSHVHADRHFRFQKCLLFVKLYIFLYLYSITLWTDQMHFPHNTFFPVRGLQPRLFWHPSSGRCSGQTTPTFQPLSAGSALPRLGFHKGCFPRLDPWKGHKIRRGHHRSGGYILIFPS